MADPVSVVSRITLKVRDECINPVMVTWLNSLGGFSQWLFERKQEVNIETTLGDVFAEPFFDIETTNRSLRQRQSSFTHSWRLTADDLTKDDLIAIAEVKRSEAVYVLRRDGETIGVIAEGLTTLYNRFSERHVFNVQINWPIDFEPERWIDA